MICYDNVSSMRHIYGTLFDNTGQPIFLKLMPEIKVTVAAKLYITAHIYKVALLSILNMFSLTIRVQSSREIRLRM